MKKLFVVLAAILFAVCYSFAGDDAVRNTKEGDKSLNFTVGGLGTFDVQGAGPSVSMPVPIPAGISCSYFLSSNSAVRCGLQMQYGSQTSPYQGIGSGQDGSSYQLAIGVSADYLTYIESSGRVRPYFGGGMLISFSANDTKYSASTGSVQEELQNQSPAGISIGARGILGAEVFILHDVSISAEYQLNIISYLSNSDEKDTYGSQTSTIKGGTSFTLLGFGTLGATAHIYF